MTLIQFSELLLTSTFISLKDSLENEIKNVDGTMIYRKGKTVTTIQKVLCLLFVCSQTTCVLAQHYSGRHVTDDNYGSSSGSGTGFVILFLLVGAGFVVYVLIHRNQKKVNNYTANSGDKPQTQSDYIKQNADYYNRIIEDNKRRKKESEDAFKGCIWGLILLGLFLLGFIIKNN